MKEFWIPCYENVPPQTDPDLCRSNSVLASDGKSMFVAFIQFDDSTRGLDDPRFGYYYWVIAGRDGYRYEPTHWLPLPELPNAS